MKKAISPLIGWILLIGFSVAMAAFISNWVIQQTKETFQPEKFLEDISCDGVAFSIISRCKTPSGTCTDGQKYSFNNIYVKNKGAFTIRNITILSLYDERRYFNTFDDYLKPGEDEPMDFGGDKCIKSGKKNEIKLIPVIEKEDKVYYCTDNAIILNNEAINQIEQCPL